MTAEAGQSQTILPEGENGTPGETGLIHSPAREGILGSHTIQEVQSNGSLVVRTHGGKQVIYPPDVMITRISQSLGALKDTQGGPTGLSSQLSREAEEVNREQFENAFGLVEAAVIVAQRLNPKFDAEGRTSEEKLEEVRAVIRATGDALIDFEKRKFEASQLDFMQSMMTTAGELFAKGLLGSWLEYLSPSERKKLASLMSTAVDLSITKIAGQIPPEQIDLGARNLVAVAQAKADSRQAGARAALETKRADAEVKKLLQGLRHESETNAIDRKHRQATYADDRDHALATRNQERLLQANAHAQQLELARRAQEDELTRKHWGAFVSNVKKFPSDTLYGAADFLFDENKGLIIKIVKAGSTSLDHLSQHPSTVRVAGLGIGAGAGLVTGLAVGTELLSSLGTVTVVSAQVGEVIVWAPGIALAVGAGALGGYLGPHMVSGVSHVYHTTVSAKDSVIDKFSTWLKNRKPQNPSNTTSSSTNP